MAGYGAGRLLPPVAAAGGLAVILAFAVWWHVSGAIRFPGDLGGIQANRELARAGPAGTLYFGLLLGVGFRTRMATPLWYAIPLAAAVGGIGAALAVGLGAGLGRSGPVARAVADSRAAARAASRGGSRAAPLPDAGKPADRAVDGAADWGADWGADGGADGTVAAGLRIATRRRSDAALAVAAVVIMGAALAAAHL
jgi:hypothetical protein